MRFRYEMPVDLHDETHEMDHNRKMKQLAIESCKTQNPFILEIVEIYKSLGKDIIFTWIPSNIGIHENTVVDQ